MKVIIDEDTFAVLIREDGNVNIIQNNNSVPEVVTLSLDDLRYLLRRLDEDD